MTDPVSPETATAERPWRSTGYAARWRLAKLVHDLAVIRGPVELSGGAMADVYVDLRRVTLHHSGAPLIGRLIREVTVDWAYAAVGGLTLGADPVATAVLHAAAAEDSMTGLDAFVVRKTVKDHGMQRLIEGPDVAGRPVLVVEDTSTTGSSVLTAVRALREAGAIVVGVVVVVDRGTGAQAAIEAEGLPYRSVLSLADLEGDSAPVPAAVPQPGMCGSELPPMGIGSPLWCELTTGHGGWHRSGGTDWSESDIPAGSAVPVVPPDRLAVVLDQLDDARGKADSRRILLELLVKKRREGWPGNSENNAYRAVEQALSWPAALPDPPSAPDEAVSQ